MRECKKLYELVGRQGQVLVEWENRGVHLKVYKILLLPNSCLWKMQNAKFLWVSSFLLRMATDKPLGRAPIVRWVPFLPLNLVFSWQSKWAVTHTPPLIWAYHENEKSTITSWLLAAALPAPSTPPQKIVSGKLNPYKFPDFPLLDSPYWLLWLGISLFSLNKINWRIWKGQRDEIQNTKTTVKQMISASKSMPDEFVCTGKKLKKQSWTSVFAPLK